MEETYVRILCPECNKDWESGPDDLPPSDNNFTCPDCGLTRRTSEFMRTEHDLRTLKQFG
ncbi:hypothetical protein BRD00_09420 [Halobacteriales archaeon QS_8_69_26]|nr:MAG: hypothetical protein BRD00_09420 [Halobacteriales archaeon QS_8_69_26]